MGRRVRRMQDPVILVKRMVAGEKSKAAMSSSKVADETKKVVSMTMVSIGEEILALRKQGTAVASTTGLAKMSHIS